MVAGSAHTLALRFDQQDRVVDAAYLGKADPWLSSMCQLVLGKSLPQVTHLDLSIWDQAFQQDQTYWDLKLEIQDDVFIPPLELLKAAIDIYKGREYLYQEASPLICRCFGVREADVLNHMHQEKEPSLESLSKQTKAGMGCRSCVPQLKRWLKVTPDKAGPHFFKEKSRAEWILDIDEALRDFPEARFWQMEVLSFKRNQVIIGYQYDVSQQGLEEVSTKLQRYLASVVDSDLGFFLKRSLQR